MLFKVSTVKMVKLFCTHLLYIIKFQTIVLILQTFVLHLTTKNLINLKFMLLILVHWRGIHKTQPTHLLLKMSNLERTNFIKNTNPLMIRDTLKKLCLLTYWSFPLRFPLIVGCFLILKNITCLHSTTSIKIKQC